MFSLNAPSEDWLLNREQLQFPQPELQGSRILVTGASGFIGQIITSKLISLGASIAPVDIEPGGNQADILSDQWVRTIKETDSIDAAVHLAAHKYATSAEDIPAQIADLNIRGTQNIADAIDGPVVLASTCKAADPCTAYGASKLIAERVILNHPYGVAIRLVNVLGSTGSVLETWRAIPENEPLPVVSACQRMWITPHEAADMLIYGLDLPKGVYGPNVPDALPVARLAERAFPGRQVVNEPLRRGDRVRERLVGEGELSEPLPDSSLIQIWNQWEGSERPVELVALG